jgi:RHS repeat-associated protein
MVRNTPLPSAANCSLVATLFIATFCVAGPWPGRAAAPGDPDPAGGLLNRIGRAPLFYQHLAWIGETAPEEGDNRPLWTAMAGLRLGNVPEGMASLERFLAQRPDSPWAPSLHANLGRYDCEHGCYSSALEHWEAAWKATRSYSSGPGKEIADFTFAYWTKLLASLGRTEALRPLFAETDGRTFDAGPLQQIVNRTKEGSHMMLSTPGICFKCGTFALMNLGRELKGNGFDVRAIDNVPSPASGFSLARVLELANQAELDLVAAAWDQPKNIVVPSIIHWKLDHYAAILKQQDGLFLVVDPTFGGPRWLEAGTIRNEASGAFLVPRSKLPSTWQLLAQAKTERIFGRGFALGVGDENDGCGNGSGGSTAGSQYAVLPAAGAASASCGSCGGASADGAAAGGGGRGAGGAGHPSPPPPPPPPPSCCDDSGQPTGMPGWQVSEPYETVWLFDTLAAVRPGIGSSLPFRVAYKQRDTRALQTGLFSLGPLWNCSWLGYVTDDSGRYGTLETMYLPLGGERHYASGVHEYFSHTLLDRTTDVSNNFTGFALSYPDGAVDYYQFVPTNFSINTYPVGLLSAKVDALGHTNSFQYIQTNDVTLLLSMTDPDGRVYSLNYTNVAFPTRITGVQDPFGRLCILQYDGSGMLTNLIDSMGMQSSIQYNSLGWATTLGTPYGTTLFQHYTNNTHAGGEFGSLSDPSYNPTLPTRAVKVIDPAGGTNVFMLKQDSSLVFTNPPDYFNHPGYGIPFLPSCYTSAAIIPAGVPTSGLDTNTDPASACLLYYRGSFHWGPRQAATLPTDLTTYGVAQFIAAGMRHWLHDDYWGGDYFISQTLDMQQEPSPDGVTPGQTVWLDYSGKTDPRFSGGADSLPCLAASVLPDGTTWYRWSRRDEWGRATNVVETYSTAFGATPLTRTNVYIYNGADPTQVLGPQGETQAGYYYDGSHHVLRATNAVGDVTYFTFDAQGRLVNTLTPAGLNRTNIYFPSGGYSNWVQTAIDLEINRTNSYTYTNDLVYTHTDERGLTTTFVYDNLQRPLSAADSRGTVSYTYDRLDLAQVVDRMGYVTSYGHDALRRVTAETNGLGYYTLYNYCTCGALDSIQDAAGNLTYFYYNNVGREIAINSPDGYSVTNNFNLLGQITNATDSAGVSVTNWFNNQGLLYASTNAFGNAKTIAFDLEDRPTNTVDANSVSISMTYDSAGRLLSRTYPDSGVEHFGYTPAGLAAYTNQLGQTNFYAYDAAGRKLFETNANAEITQFTYQPAGDLASLTDGKSQTTQWNYDQYGRVTNKLDQAGTVILKYIYDADDRLTSRWSAAMGATYYTNDALGNVTLVKYPTMANVIFDYDCLNRLTNMMDGIGTTVYAYTSAGQLLSESGPFGNSTVTNGYQNRLRTAMGLQQPAGEWTNSFGYDAIARLSSVTSPAGTLNYQFQPGLQRLVSGLQLPNTSTITNIYDSQARLLATRLVTSGSSLLDSASYGYNTAGQRTSFTNAAGTYVLYSYDKIGQLTVADSSVNTEDRGYYYDTAWNLNRRTNNGTASSFWVDVKNELTNAPAGAAAYDANGNQITSANSRYDFTYDDENRLIEWLDNGTIHAVPRLTDFVYDGLGRLRVRLEYVWNSGSSSIGLDGAGGSGSWSLSSETHYIYDGKRVIQERDGNNNPTVSYTRGTDLGGSLEGAGGIGGLLARSDGYSSGNWTSHNYYHADGNGNITYLENSSQGLAASYRYDPFGNTISSSGTLAAANLYRFSSKECHVNSAMYYYLYRFYDPNLQRWTNRDPLEESAGLNLYTAFRGDPVGFVDPLGLQLIIPVPGRPRPPGALPWPFPQPLYPHRPSGPTHPISWPSTPHTLPRRDILCKAQPLGDDMEKKKCRQQCHDVYDQDEDLEELQFCIRRCNGGWFGPTPRPVKW